ncbi:MAG: NUDIX domain-containing protein [Planctomycetota bacterium]
MTLPHRKWQQISKEPVLQNPWYKMSRDSYVLPTGATGVYTYVDIPGSTMVVPRLDDGRFVLVRQFRYLFQRTSLEFPAGGLKEGIEALANARAELREEGGYVARDWQRIGQFAPYNGVSNEYCQVFLATGLERVEAAPEETEEIEVVPLAIAELRREIASGAVWDGMTISALALYDALHSATSRAEE